MLTQEILDKIQNGAFDTALDTIRHALTRRAMIVQREDDAEVLSEQRGAMREAMYERNLERRQAPAVTFKPGDIVRIKQTSNLSPRYLVGRELVFLKARISNGEVRYLVPDRTKYGSVAKFACPMRELEFVRKG